MDVSAATAKCIAGLSADARKATVYVDEKTVVSVCRRFRFSRRNTHDDFVLKIGAPNYEERDFIRRCKRAGEPLPVRKVQLKFWPAKKK